MRPKTVVQKEVMHLSATLPHITSRDMKSARKCFYITKFTYGGNAWCSECGRTFADHGNRTCPHCRRRFEETEVTRKRVDRHNRSYFVILDTVGRWQIMRYVRVIKESKKGEDADYNLWEVMQLWFANGHYEIVSRCRCAGSYVDTFNLCSDLEIRNVHKGYGPLTIEDVGYSYIVERGILPQLQRLKFDSNDKCIGFGRRALYKLLFANPMAETLIENGHKDILHVMNNQGKLSKDYFAAVKIALRNHYPAVKKETASWLDMVDALLYLGKDIRNSFFVCPEKFMIAHDKWIGLAERRRREVIDRAEREIKERMMELDSKAVESYNKSHAKYLGFKLTDGVVVIKVLLDVESFKREAEYMHHCVYDNGYWKKPQSLIMSATVEGVREETIEVDLKSLKLVQSRGKYNKPTPYHDKIVKLVEDNMNKIQEIAL